mmetsp:Transcript_15851/g.60003  ORF Transcript_15851/g.60003 Transcript_15851/m.60003 type:complete len:207 (-) Transcript_15851:826-1446(-)
MPPRRSAQIGASAAMRATGWDMTATMFNAISFCENVRQPRPSMPAATTSLSLISPVPRVHPMEAPATLRYASHPSADHLRMRLSRPSLDSAYSPSPPNTPWLGLSGNTARAGRVSIPRERFASTTAPSRRRVLVSMMRWASSDLSSRVDNVRPASPMAAKGTTKSRSMPRLPYTCETRASTSTRDAWLNGTSVREAPRAPKRSKRA